MSVTTLSAGDFGGIEATEWPIGEIAKIVDQHGNYSHYRNDEGNHAIFVGKEAPEGSSVPNTINIVVPEDESQTV